MPAEPIYVTFDDLSKPVRLVDCEDLCELLPRAFSGWPFSIVSGNQEAPIISLTRQDGNYILEGALLAKPLTRNDAVGALCALVAELMRAYVHQDDKLLCLHGAAAEFAGRLVVFPSQYRAGKSILSACLAAAGVQIFCDDVLPISRAQGRGVAPGLALRLRRPLPDNLAPESLHFIEKHNCLQGKHYMYLQLDESEMAERGKTLPVGAFVLLEREAGATTMLEDVSDAEILRQVVWQNFAREAEAPEILAVLSKLVADSQCFRLRYDCAEDAGWLLQQEFKSWPDTNSGSQANTAIAFESKAVACDLAPGYYRQNPEIKFVQLDDQGFLADREGAAIHHLNSTGSSIWALLAEPMTEDEVIEVLLTAFPDLDRDQVGRDVGNLVEELRHKNLLRRGGE